MVLVIAIIVILAAVMLLGVGKYVKYSKTAASEMKSHNDATESVGNEISAVI
jgi:type IV pilus assembly protein PilA